MNQTQDSYRGALIGAAIGDSLGATVDDMSRDEVKGARVCVGHELRRHVSTMRVDRASHAPRR